MEIASFDKFIDLIAESNDKTEIARMVKSYGDIRAEKGIERAWDH